LGRGLGPLRRLFEEGLDLLTFDVYSPISNHKRIQIMKIRLHSDIKKELSRNCEMGNLTKAKMSIQNSEMNRISRILNKNEKMAQNATQSIHYTMKLKKN